VRPVGQPTRGKTAPNRLRKTDTFLALAYAERLRGLRGCYVDLGFGALPVTSIETLRRLRRLNPALRVIGVEIDPVRVATARAWAEPGLEFRLGGFNLPLGPDETAGVIRAFNVLRQYDEAQVQDALDRLASRLAPGGLLIEGTSDPTGRLLSFLLHERRGAGLERVGLVMAPRVDAALEPRRLQAVLPKSFVHRVEPGGPVDRFFAAWARAWQASRRAGAEPRVRFAAAGLELGRQGWTVDRRPGLLRRGFLVLGPDWPAAAGAAAP
jgi:hypothetical protein